jgi:hypothetical protein
VVGITGDCPTQILCKNWSTSFQGMLQALHNLQKQSSMKTHTHIPLSAILSIIALESKLCEFWSDHYRVKAH